MAAFRKTAGVGLAFYRALCEKAPVSASAW
jgi:hypothetical protein